MRPTQRKILILLVISFFIAGLYASTDTYPEPKICDSDNDCLKGKAKCIRRECHCTEELAIGDGKNKCEVAGVKKCDNSFCKNKKFKNSYCLVNPAGKKVCKCNPGHFGGAKHGKCLSKDYRNYVNNQASCLSNKNCHKYARCYKGYCSCQSEYTGKFKRDECTFERHTCDSKKKCHHAKAACKNGVCYCKGMMVGNGYYCREATACPKDVDVQCPENSKCMVDSGPGFFKKTTWCACKPGYGKNKAGKCAPYCSNNQMCTTYSICDKEEKLCTCKVELILGETSCEAAPPHPCKTDKDCHAKAKCEHGECFCQGTYVGNGKNCRASTPCKGNKNVPEEQKNCGSHATCRVDPERNKHATCKCDPGYYKNAAGKCVECVKNDHCSGKGESSICNKDSGTCGCKAELLMGKTSCEAAPLHVCQTNEDCNSRAKCEHGKCICQANTIGNGEFCRDEIKPCAFNHTCHAHSHCAHDPLLPGVPFCQCDEGYTKSADGKSCEDIKECSNATICSAHSKCEDSEGSYKCTCNKGYRMNEKTKICEDVDECAENPKICPTNERCINTEGKHECSCDREGYMDIGGACVQTDECNNACKKHQKCIQGKCKCKKGYRKDKKGDCKKLPRFGGGLLGAGVSLHVSSHLLSALILGMLGRLAFTA